MKKRVVSLCMAVLLLTLAVMPLYASAMTWSAYVKTANGKGLNLRTGPTTNASIQKSIPYGASVTIINLYDDSWAQVDYKGYEGYVMRRYLTYDKPGPKPTAKPTSAPSGGGVSHLYDGFQAISYYASVRPSTPGGFVHMRWAPTKQSGIMSDYHQGDVLEVLSQNNSWAQVRNTQTGATGFMMRSFLTTVVATESVEVGSGTAVLD